MGLQDNIGIALLQAAQQHANKVAFSAPDGNLSHGQFANIITMMVFELRRHGVRRGSCVAIHIPDPRAFIVGVSACSLLGAAWTMRSWEDNETVSGMITHHLFDAAQLLQANKLIQSGTPGKPVIFDPRRIKPAMALAALRNEMPQGYEDGTSLARIGSSSGTTGERKAIWTSARDEWRRVQWSYRAMEDVENIACYSLFPPFSGVGTNVRIHTLLSGGTVVELPTAEKLKQITVNQVIGSPAQYVGLINKLEIGGITEKLPLAMVGGGRPSPDFLDSLRKHFKKISVFFGSTEMGNVAEYPDAAEPGYDGRLKHQDSQFEAQIVDEDTNPLSHGTLGLVRIRNFADTPHYIGDDAANAKAFNDGWFYSGDLGMINDEGYLFLEGRSNDTANLGGVKINMLTFDEFVQSFPGIDDAYCFVGRDQRGIDRLSIVARFQPETDVKENAEELVAAMRKTAWFRPVLRAIYSSENIPRTDTGKPMRREASEICAKLEPIDLALSFT